ncbi:hypothetical protein CEXT_701771 [Caerostris extrusa]|uniref:Uncharacterized protein n=1 Tax=Caerostris extrusa TaxID=172846 RepID=A0AAV4Y1I5_CAEEX|nr:hypothetical protein CEXT_701771 [Caerostris extrusa]
MRITIYHSENHNNHIISKHYDIHYPFHREFQHHSKTRRITIHKITSDAVKHLITFSIVEKTSIISPVINVITFDGYPENREARAATDETKAGIPLLQ